MPRIELSRISPGVSELNGRFLNYEVHRVNPNWWQLRIELPVRFRWAFEYAGLWTQDRKRRVQTLLRRHAAESWSRRYRLVRRSWSDLVRTEVLVTLRERDAPNNQLWHVVVYPQGGGDGGSIQRPEGFVEEPEPICVAYHWRGWTHDIPRPVGDTPELEDIGACFLWESSVLCLPSQ